MRSLIPPELTLDCSLSPNVSVHKSTGEILLEVSGLRTAPEKISKLEDHVNRLQAEMKKIEGFRRELPLCMILVADAIGTVKKEIIQCRSSISEPIMEEFMPIKKTSTDEKDDKVEEKNATIISSRDKMSWMSSVQLWNSGNNNNNNNQQQQQHQHQHQHHSHHHSNTENVNTLNSPPAKRDSNKKRKEELFNGPMMDDLFPSGKNRKIEKAFEPLKGCSVFPAMNIGKEGRNELSGVTELSLLTPEFIPETKNSKEEIYTNGFSSKTSSSRSESSSPSNGQSIKEQTTRKQRRCWSPELHCRFVSALQRLGGPQVATPKQIRELMQIDGLTNDEVKSHLQKYRLHNRKATQTANPSPIDLGGLWVSQEHCGESSKLSNSQSGSPQGPFHLNGTSMVTSITCVDSMEEEEEEDDAEKSHGHMWKGHNHLSKRIEV